MQNSLFVGFALMLSGFRLILQPQLRWFLLVPVTANIALFVLLFAWAKTMFSSGISYLMVWIPEWLAFLEWAFWLIYVIAMGLLFFYAFVSTANFIGAPFYGFLAEVLEQKLTGKKDEEALTVASIAKLVPRTIGRELRKLAYYLPRVLALVALGFVPGVNAIVAVVWIMFSAWMMAIQFIDYPADNNQLSFGELRAFLSDYRFAAFGFGLCTFGLTLVPIVNLIVLPAAVCGAVAFWVKAKHDVDAKSLMLR